MGLPSRPARGALVPRTRTGPLPLSYNQERLWHLDQLEAGRGARYQIVRALHLRGPFDLAAFQHALDALVHRHESLRTHFGAVEDVPQQFIDPPGPVKLPFVNLSGSTEAERRATVEQVLRE